MPSLESRRGFLTNTSSLALTGTPCVLSPRMRQERILESMGLAPQMLAVADVTRNLGGIGGV